MTKPRIKKMSFEKYLEQVCFEANPQVLDDDMPDFFDDWLGSQDGEDYIRLADEYAKSIYTEAKQEGRDEVIRIYGSPKCENLHHKKAHQHKVGEPCPVEQTIKALQAKK